MLWLLAIVGQIVWLITILALNVFVFGYRYYRYHRWLINYRELTNHRAWLALCIFVLTNDVIIGSWLVTILWKYMLYGLVLVIGLMMNRWALH